MRFHEIIAETPGDNWEDRHCRFQKNETKRQKLRTKLNAANDTAVSHNRQAADRRRADDARVRDLRRQLTAPPSTT